MFRNLKDKIFKKLSDIKIVEVKVGDIKYGITKFKKLSDNKDKMYGISWDEEQLIMRDEIKNGNYDDSKGLLPVISKNNVILDGYHRLTSLNYYHGSDYTIKVEKTNHNYFKYGLYFLIFYLLEND
jgi:adenylate kinase